MAKSKKPNRLKLKALSNLSGVYNLPYSQGQEFSIDAERGKELIANNDAVEVK